MYRGLRQAVKQAGPEIVQLARELVRIRSTSLSEQELAGCIESAMGDLGFDLVFRDDVGNVIGAYVGSKSGPTVLLNSHMDTVLPHELEWSESPYSGAVADDWLFGVGAADCKGGLAAQIHAAALLAASPLPVAGNIVVAATVAEENGCSVGVRHVIEESLPRIGMVPACAILGEPTSLAICCGHDGWVDIDVTIGNGTASNARQVAQRVTDTFRQSAPEYSGASRRVLMRTSDPFVAGDDSGHRYTVRVVRRLTPGQVSEGLVEWVRRRAVEAVGESRASVDVAVHEEQQHLFTGHTASVRFETRPWETDRFEPLVDGAREALAEAGWRRVNVTGWQLRDLGMGTAGSVLVRDYHIPTIGFGPGDERVIHKPNEVVGVRRMVEAADGTAVLAHRFVGAPAFEWPTSERSTAPVH
jgi:acetylornithine deacetylase/succinyl-diaminopimelate desuccinylase-like protein